MRSDLRAGIAAIVLTFVAAASGCSILLCLWCPVPARDVVSDGPGGGETCYRNDVSKVPDLSGDVAIVRRSYCPGQNPEDVGYDFYIVFVHPASERNTRDNIALQYVPGTDDLRAPSVEPPREPLWTDDLSQPPEVEWSGPR